MTQTSSVLREAMQAVRHDVPDPSTLALGVDEGRSDVILTVTVGKLVGEFVRYVHHQPEGALTVNYEVQINGIDDVGAGIAMLHLENPRALRDLSEVITVLYMEWTGMQR
jgi:hypothetical protein